MSEQIMSARLCRNLPEAPFKEHIEPIYEVRINGKLHSHKTKNLFKNGRLIQVLCELDGYPGLVSFTIDLKRREALNAHALHSRIEGAPEGLSANNAQGSLEATGKDSVSVYFKRLRIQKGKESYSQVTKKLALAATQHHFTNFDAQQVTD